MLTPEMLSQKIQVPRTPWTQCFVCLFVCFKYKYATFQNRRAGPKRSCSLRRHRGRRLDGLVWQCWDLPVTNWTKQRLQRTFSGIESQKDSFSFEGKDSTTRWKREVIGRFQSRKDLLFCILVPSQNPLRLFTFDFCPKTQCETSGQGREDGGAWSEHSGIQTARALLRVEQLIEILNVIWPTCAF